MPNVMAALLNIGGALCSKLQSLADAHCWSTMQQRCQDEKPIEICWGAPNSPTVLSHCWAEVHHTMRTCGGGIGV